MIIRYSNTKNLKPAEKKLLDSIIETELPKVERLVPDALELLVDIKTLKPEDKKTRRHILNFQLRTRKSGIFRTKIGESDMKRSGSYDLKLGIRMSMKKLQTEINHKLKRDMSTWKKLSEKLIPRHLRKK